MILQVQQLFGEIDDIGHRDVSEIDEKDENLSMSGMDIDVSQITYKNKYWRI